MKWLLPCDRKVEDMWTTWMHTDHLARDPAHSLVFRSVSEVPFYLVSQSVNLDRHFDIWVEITKLKSG